VARAVSIAVPAAFVVVATVLLVGFDSRGSEAAAYTLYGCAVLLALSSAIFRLGLESNDDRDREEAARVFFDEHGRWPGRGEL
jgi:hypothetical protein